MTDVTFWSIIAAIAISLVAIANYEFFKNLAKNGRNRRVRELA